MLNRFQPAAKTMTFGSPLLILCNQILCIQQLETWRSRFTLPFSQILTYFILYKLYRTHKGNDFATIMVKSTRGRSVIWACGATGVKLCGPLWKLRGSCSCCSNSHSHRSSQCHHPQRPLPAIMCVVSETDIH